MCVNHIYGFYECSGTFKLGKNEQIHHFFNYFSIGDRM